MIITITGLVQVNTLIFTRVSKRDLEIITLLYLSTIEVPSLTRLALILSIISNVLNQSIGVEILLAFIFRLYLIITIFVFYQFFSIRFAKKLLIFGLA